ncbi:MAG: hypothetical protein HN736_14125 [Anaerolineae bacterium]|jgi:hypothetical protein|nr:hypothetical protein [Anaerolineae bacterium]MBT3712774.1 hypothetical protein [Anaerolineae bacterium]MBT4311227.1 hypothetical protein [Anaerolineae bacterium]MBT4459280.1 hypothetical protein [Anaerolineae bacterium]MBT4841294.1 hypothetical protein [Anaerolineae bacterium]
MPSIIDHETMHVDDLPAIWSPIQWELSEEERVEEINTQATASLLWAMDAPEAILRLLLNEEGIQQLGEAPEGYDLEAQGEWSEEYMTFGSKHSIKLDSVTRERDALHLVYKVGDSGYWQFEITPERVIIERI